jgi:alpha-beta hydrolase superfamily lysophospholipase
MKVYDGLLHELFHEPERDLVFRDMLAWLDERAKPAARVVTGK